MSRPGLSISAPRRAYRKLGCAVVSDWHARMAFGFTIANGQNTRIDLIADRRTCLRELDGGQRQEPAQLAGLKPRAELAIFHDHHTRGERQRSAGKEQAAASVSLCPA